MSSKPTLLTSTFDGSEHHKVKIERMPTYKPVLVEVNDDDEPLTQENVALEQHTPRQEELEPSSDIDLQEDSDLEILESEKNDDNLVFMPL